MSSQISTLPGLVRDESELIASIEHHLAHALVAMGDALEISEDNDCSLFDGCELSAMMMEALVMLLKIRSLKAEVAR